MDHRYIDDHSVAERYLDHTLPPGERSRFEAHLVDCQECTDRILLAEMFRQLNGNRHNGALHAKVPHARFPLLRPQKSKPEALRSRFVPSSGPCN